MKRKHGYAHRGDRTYRAWGGMHSRCRNPKVERWPRYGGRGITVCERWHSFENFLADMGECAPGMSLERDDHDGNYEPGNCRWIPKAEQSRNKSDNRWIEANGERRLLEDWARSTGIRKTTIYMRITAYGWSPSDAVNTPAGGRRASSI